MYDPDFFSVGHGAFIKTVSNAREAAYERVDPHKVIVWANMPGQTKSLSALTSSHNLAEEEFEVRFDCCTIVGAAICRKWIACTLKGGVT